MWLTGCSLSTARNGDFHKDWVERWLWEGMTPGLSETEGQPWEGESALLRREARSKNPFLSDGSELDMVKQRQKFSRMRE